MHCLNSRVAMFVQFQQLGRDLFGCWIQSGRIQSVAADKVSNRFLISYLAPHAFLTWFLRAVSPAM
jgi:hypothetical protein